MITMIKRKSVFHPEDFVHTHKLGFGSKMLIYDINFVCARARARKSVCTPASAYINFAWSCQKVSYLQISNMRTQPRSSLRKTGFVYLFCLHFFFHSFCQSVFSAFYSLWLCTMLLIFSTLLKMLWFRSTNVIPMLYKKCFIFLHLFDLQTDREHNINSPNAIRYYLLCFFSCFCYRCCFCI